MGNPSSPGSPAQSRGLRKAGRDIFQAVLAVIAAGGGYALIDLIVDSVSPVIGVALALFFKILVTYAQNYLETRGSIPALLPTPGLITNDTGKTVDKVVGTVDVVADTAGAATGVVGEVVNTAGNVVGAVTGTVTNLGKGK